MATAPVISTGMSIGAAGAGAGGALTGDVTGLDGLFAALVGGDMAAPATGAAQPLAAPAEGGEDGVISVLLGARSGLPLGGDSRMPPSGLTEIFTSQPPVYKDVQLGDGPVMTLSGDAASLSAFVDKLEDIYQKLVVEGGLTIGQLGDSKELAGALTKLGMAPDEAMGVAERIQTMLKLLKEQQEVDEKTAGSLAAMMLAVMGQGTATPGTAGEASELGLQIVSAEAAPVAAAPAGTATMTAWTMRVGGDVTRDLLGLAGEKPVKAEDAAGGTERPRTLEVTVTTDDGAGVSVALPELPAKPLPVAHRDAAGIPTSAAVQATAAAAMPGTVTKVDADETIEAPKGETYYKLQADKNGVETLDAVKPVGEMRQDAQVALPAAGQTVAQTQAAEAAAVQTAQGSAFADRVAQVQDMVEKAQVGRQVAIQLAPLAEQGGGTVRMHLNPVELGRITIELNVADGKVHGSIAASEPAVVEQLARELHSLRHGLADAGLKLGEQGINLMLSNSNHQGQQGQQGQHAQQGQGPGHRNASGGTADGGAAEGDGSLATNLAGWVSPDRVLDVNV